MFIFNIGTKTYMFKTEILVIEIKCGLTFNNKVKLLLSYLIQLMYMYIVNIQVFMTKFIYI